MKANCRDSPPDIRFCALNCAALAETLLESELFGHERGAYTGADRRREGRFEQANLGTLFLDEIGDITPSTQVKLLRVLQERKFRRLGGLDEVEADIRIIAATNQDLSKAVAENRFREDLFYRINVINLHLPPLRERREDIPLLADHFLQRYREQMGKAVTAVSGEAMAMLQAYRWPGNIRELRNVVERMAILSPDPITADAIPVEIRLARQAGAPTTLEETRAQAERDMIRQALDRADWNVSAAARALGVERTRLHKRIRALGLER